MDGRSSIPCVTLLSFKAIVMYLKNKKKDKKKHQSE